jgi:NADH:ubiquinone oxidoreductase subunit 4 (subunit M)
VILAAVYLLWMYQRFVFGLPKGASPAAHGHDHAAEIHHDGHATPDLSWRELVAVVPMVAFMLWIGIQPMNFMQMSEKTMYKISDDLLKLKTGDTTTVVSSSLRGATKERSRGIEGSNLVVESKAVESGIASLRSQ